MNESIGINILEFSVPQVKVFGLALARISALISVVPVFGSGVVPVSLKAMFSLILALILTPMLAVSVEPLPDDTLGYATLAVGEVIVGLMIGFAVFLVFIGVQMAGQMVDFLLVFGIMFVINPAIETQAPLVGFFKFVIAMLIFLAVEGHHRIIISLFQSFESVPMTTFSYSEALTGRMATLIDSPELRKEMGQKGREKALELYNAEYHFGRIMEIYRELIRSSS